VGEGKSEKIDEKINEIEKIEEVVEEKLSDKTEEKIKLMRNQECKNNETRIKQRR